MKSADEWIAELELEKHPEGGWYRRVFTSELIAEGGKAAVTSIYYLLKGGDFSAWHRLKSDELWFFHSGAPLTIHEINAAGEYGETVLGGAVLQHAVPAGTLFGASVDGGYALVSCAVAPGFDVADFEMPPRDQLCAEFPNQYDHIVRLSR